MNVNGKPTDNECPAESETTDTESFVEVMSAPLDGFQNLGISGRQSWRKLSLPSKENLDVVRTVQNNEEHTLRRRSRPFLSI